MDVQKKLDEIVAAVGSARSMPMSASCVVNRADLLAMLEEVRQALPGSLAQAQELIGGREQMVEQARAEADRIIETAHAERGSLISDTEIARRSQNEAERILTEARQEAEEVRAEADDYVDSKLANFEVVLTKTLGSVGRGREKLLGTGPGTDEQGYEDADAPERSHDPETLRRDADAYVDTKLGAFEAVLAKTLDAVGKGRQKLHGRLASDDLGALSMDGEGGPQAHTSDADYLAGLAEIGGQDQTQGQSRNPAQGQEQQPDPTAVPQIPAQQPQQPADAYAQQQDPYGYQQQGYGQQDPYAAYQQQDPYAYQQPQQDPYAAYQQQDPFGYQQPPHQDQQPHHDQQQDQAGALDETSLFDTSMISLEQMRQYEQGR
ncbi:ATP synthase F0 subunit B [Streptomyces kunmingensis]|uniref:ATP synthase F0 subunit B n=1 Tax=Streptomyces kunmingensis TaxID=68225 RepID=A0ABU6C6M9_9ACTN|nr:ATP synthase F0 subunit B [Streptomyces kunmingensis]MEB3960371.1 ATP synthase F0 subunit B [Streptomyces kunmingensis]